MSQRIRPTSTRIGFRLAAIAVAMLSAFSLTSPVLASDTTPATAAPAICDPAAVIKDALHELGETAERVHIVPDAQVEKETPGAAAYTVGDDVTYSATGTPCEYLRGLVAHETAHVWQFRAFGTSAAAHYGSANELEVVADCFVAFVDWDWYYPYVKDQKNQCTDAEMHAAVGLQNWAR